MLDWMIFWDQLIYWVQWISTFALICLIGIACIGYIFRNKKWTIDCGIIAVALLVIAIVLERFGIKILVPEIYNFFQGIFN